MMSPWRMLMIYTTGWLILCALWVGLTRRTSLQTVAITLIVNGTILAALGIHLRLTGSATMFWGLSDRAGWFFSTFIYKNHAGAFFNLKTAVRR